MNADFELVYKDLSLQRFKKPEWTSVISVQSRWRLKRVARLFITRGTHSRSLSWNKYVSARSRVHYASWHSHNTLLTTMKRIMWNVNYAVHMHSCSYSTTIVIVLVIASIQSTALCLATLDRLCFIAPANPARQVYMRRARIRGCFSASVFQDVTVL